MKEVPTAKRESNASGSQASDLVQPFNNIQEERRTPEKGVSRVTLPKDAQSRSSPNPTASQSASNNRGRYDHVRSQIRHLLGLVVCAVVPGHASVCFGVVCRRLLLPVFESRNRVVWISVRHCQV